RQGQSLCSPSRPILLQGKFYAYPKNIKGPAYAGPFSKENDVFYYFTRLISTLLFCFLPALVLLVAIGLASPYPMAVNRSEPIPLSIRKFLTELALSSESLWFKLSLPTLSV